MAARRKTAVRGEKMAGIERLQARLSNFLAAPALARQREKEETERVQRLREAGVTNPEEFLPEDWAEPVGEDVQVVPELLADRAAGGVPRSKKA